MTALVYAYRHVTSRITLGDISVARSFQFSRINQKNVVTFCLLGIMLLGAFQYLGGLYEVFSFGLRLQSENREIGILSQEVNTLELKAQRATANLSIKHKELLSSMEKISHVRYITGEQEAVSYASSHQ